MKGGRYHLWFDIDLCIYCGRHCEQCNQCKCDVGKRKFLCPGFDAKENPMALEHWLLELDIFELESSITFGRHLPIVRSKLQIKLDELYRQVDALANPDL